MKHALRLFAFAALLAGLLAVTPCSAEEALSSGSARGMGKELTPRDPSREVQQTPRQQTEIVPADSTSGEVGRSEPRTDSTFESRGRTALAQPGCTICLGGTASVQWTSSTGSFHVDTIANNRSSGSGPLELKMVLSSASPVFGLTIHTYDFSDSISESPLGAGYYYSNVSSGTLAFYGASIGVGEYFLMLLLRENVSGTIYYDDWVLFDKKVYCNGTGCSIITPCAEDANTACLIGGRYMVTSHWKNQYAGGATANLSKTKLTDATNAFWLSDAGTYEFVIRLTAGNNGRMWVAILTFTDVEFWVDVTDTKTGQYKEYHSDPGNRTLIYDPYYFVYP